jgi:succinate dehydrogenase/fumarate reductase flavoprotein subunit
MTAEEFRILKKYSFDGHHGLLMEDEFGNPISYQTFAEAYKEHERERYEALVRLTNSEEFDELEMLLDKAIEDRDYFEKERDKLQKKVEELKGLLKEYSDFYSTDYPIDLHRKAKQALKK